jgi:hypothetical protein
MDRIIEHQLVNWVDGMKISKAHFQQTEDYFMDCLCDNIATRLNHYNYGLLPSSRVKATSGEFEINEQFNHRVEIKLHRCHAITSGGYRICYEPEGSEFMMCDFSIDKEEKLKPEETHIWDVILGVNPFNRVPAGLPDADENPPRHPNVGPSCQLTVLPSGQANPERMGMYHLIIGRIRYKNNCIEVDNNYIPPCTSMSSHRDLLEYYEKFSGYISRIETASRNIIAKVQNQQKSSTIAININQVCKEIMRYISMVYFMYRNTGRTMEPLRVVNYFSSLAHICISVFSFLNKQEKEELLKYFYEWNDVTPGTFEDILAETAGIIYNHNNIRESMITVEQFLNIFSELWMNLGKLEYIGQSKDNVIVTVKSSQTEIFSSTWSVID